MFENNRVSFSHNEKQIYIDLMRAISAILVLTVHLSNALPTKGILHSLLEKGAHGVEIFFLISGYLGVKTYKNRTLKNYYLSRFFRIVPIYYVIIIIQMLDFKILKFKPEPDILKLGWIRYFTFLTTTLPSKSDYWTNLCATWTIPCFIVFYLVLPLILKKIRNFKNSVILGTGLFIVGEFGFDILFKELKFYYGWDFSVVAGFFPWRYLWFFMIGVIAYFAIMEQKISDFLILLSVLLFIRNYNISMNTRIEWLVVGSILLIALYNRKIKRRAISSMISIISEYSYSLYLSHPLILNVLGSRRDFFYNDILFMISIFICIVLLTYILHNLVEVPCSMFFKKYLKNC